MLDHGLLYINDTYLQSAGISLKKVSSKKKENEVQHREVLSSMKSRDTLLSHGRPSTHTHTHPDLPGNISGSSSSSVTPKGIILPRFRGGKRDTL